MSWERSTSALDLRKFDPGNKPAEGQDIVALAGPDVVGHGQPDLA